MENTEETFLVSAQHLKRRDRTPIDCGYYLTFTGIGIKGDNLIQKNICFASASTEEIKSYETTRAAAEKKRDEERVAKSAAVKVQAEEAVAALMTEFDLEDELEKNGAPGMGLIINKLLRNLETNGVPGMTLLKKLLRTEISTIRTEQLQHDLVPTIDSDGIVKPLISHSAFIEAISNAFTQIHTLLAAGGTDQSSAMNLLKKILQVAMEARVVLLDNFGERSREVNEFERDLEPVFAG